MTAKCAHCGGDCRLTSGAEIYPLRKGLYTLHFWLCDSCSAFVGCHKGGDGTKPLGTAANKELRKLRGVVHAIIDPKWRNGAKTRSQVYAEMTMLVWYIGLDIKQFHTAALNTEQANKVIKELRTGRWLRG